MPSEIFIHYVLLLVPLRIPSRLSLRVSRKSIFIDIFAEQIFTILTEYLGCVLGNVSFLHNSFITTMCYYNNKKKCLLNILLILNIYIVIRKTGKFFTIYPARDV